MKRRFDSGFQKREKVEKIKKHVESLPKMDKFITAPKPDKSSSSAEPDIPEGIYVTPPSSSSTPSTLSSVTTTSSLVTSASSSESDTLSSVQCSASSSCYRPDDFEPLSNDIGEWPAPQKISNAQRCDVVDRGLVQVEINFPYNDAKRRFSAIHYKRKMKNGEITRRQWLMYSISKDCIYCFYCVLFGCDDVPLRHGTNTWEGLAKKLYEHEVGKSHQKCLDEWITLRKGIACKQTIDDHELSVFQKERNFWRAVLERLIDIVIFLSERNLAFRGSEEVFGSQHNGNFLGLFELMAKRDYVLQELHNRVLHKKTAEHYLSKDVQNELIQLVAKKIEQENMKLLKSAKYFAVILDCTPDISHEEQMTVILRFVHCKPTEGIEVKETFFGYLNVLDTTGRGLLESFLEKIETWSLDIQDCRGQSYDNGSNMKGKNAGVQARMRELNPKAFYVPCASHSLNLVIVDGAKSSTAALTFFGTLTRLYTIFSSSPVRWNILKSNLEITVKNECDTRWESRANCVKAVRYQFPEVLVSLEELVKHVREQKDSKTTSEALSLLNSVSSWPFLLSVVIWYDVLFQINKTSKLLQTKGVALDVLQSELTATRKFFLAYRDHGFTDAVTTAKEIAEALEIEQEYPVTRTRKRKKQFQYEGNDEPLTGEGKFKNEFFLVLIDTTLTSINERFAQISQFAELFGFLYSAENLIHSCDSGTLLEDCERFEKKTDDIDSNELVSECTRFSCVLKDNASIKSAPDMLRYLYVNDLQDIYGNLAIALRILLTVPVTVATAERSFSKLKLIKTFNRSSMKDERLSGLAMVSIESVMARRLDMTDVIDTFATSKVRKKPF